MIALCVLLGATAAANDDPYASVRAEFRQAYAQLLHAGRGAAAADSEQLQAYPLYPYLERARITAALSAGAAPADDAARNLLERHAGEPVASELRGTWLRSLARRAQWRTFVDQYRDDGDVALRCELLNARIALGETADLEPAILAVWLTPERLPAECEAPFEWLRARSGLAPDVIEQRVRLLLENGQTAFARVVARRLPPERAAPLLTWADLLDRPAVTIDALLSGTAAAEAEPLLAGWEKLARNDPQAALERYERVVAMSTVHGGARSRLALALALGLAWDRRAEANELFSHVQASDIDDYSLAWQARAALWARDWPTVAASIDALSPAERAHPRWRYWAARAAGERGDKAAARRLYESVLASDNYYAAMAAARLGKRAEPHPESLPPDALQLQALASRPGLVRVRELLLCDLPVAATIEWLAEYAQLAEADRKQTIHLAASWGWHDVSVATATRQNVFFDYVLLYPRPYGDAIRSAARLAKLDAALLYGVIRQESLFRADAVSAAGAIGLAQLQLETARIVARQWQQPLPKTADLLDPSINTRLGASYLRTLVDRYDGQLPVALAAYNAGPNAAARWLPGAALEADIWIENIPFNETREYVQRVLWHSVVFGWLQSGKAQQTASWLAPISPAASDL